MTNENALDAYLNNIDQQDRIDDEIETMLEGLDDGVIDGEDWINWGLLNCDYEELTFLPIETMLNSFPQNQADYTDEVKLEIMNAFLASLKNQIAKKIVGEV